MELQRKIQSKVYILYKIISSHRTSVLCFVLYGAQICQSPKLVLCAFLLRVAQITFEYNELLLTNLFLSHFGSSLVFSWQKYIQSASVAKYELTAAKQAGFLDCLCWVLNVY